MPEPWGPMTPAVRSHGTHRSPPRGSWALPMRQPTSQGSNLSFIASSFVSRRSSSQGLSPWPSAVPVASVASPAVRCTGSAAACLP